MLGTTCMANRNIKIETHSGLGLAWFVGWLFTVGFLSKGFWGGLLALIVWPYMLGNHFQP